MVYTVFTWSHGGRDVFLCGSFDGWIQKIPMVSVEGSSTIFQRICDLPPGYHQYKFFVDGAWRTDDQQLCIQDEYGTINNLIIVREPELVSRSLHGEASQPRMDIDNLRTNEHEASSSGSLPHEPPFGLHASGVDVSHHWLINHLSTYRTYELIPASSKVFVFDGEVAVKDAFHVMHEQGLAVVPLLDEHSTQISGMLTASDFILILIELHNNRSVLTNEQLEMHTISAWKEEKSQSAVANEQVSYRRPVIQVGPDESLKDLALKILQNNISTVPIIHSEEDGSCSKLLHIVCLSSILKHVCRHFRHHLGYVSLLQQPVGSLPIGAWRREVGRASNLQLLTLRPTNPLISALNIFLEAQVSSVPVVDDSGSLINVYARSDITSLVKGNVYTRIELDQVTMSQALELVDDTHGRRYKTCTRSDSLFMVMELLSDPAVRRLIVVQSGGHQVEGIITLKDIFSLILN